MFAAEPAEKSAYPILFESVIPKPRLNDVKCFLERLKRPAI